MSKAVICNRCGKIVRPDAEGTAVVTVYEHGGHGGIDRRADTYDICNKCLENTRIFLSRHDVDRDFDRYYS